MRNIIFLSREIKSGKNKGQRRKEDEMHLFILKFHHHNNSLRRGCIWNLVFSVKSNRPEANCRPALRNSGGLRPIVLFKRFQRCPGVLI